MKLLITLLLLLFQLNLFGQDNFHPQWSPVDDLIVFDSDMDGMRTLYTIKPDGTDLKKIPIDFDSSMVHPSWSPEGKSLVFETQSADNWDLYRVNLDGTDLTRLTRHPSRDFLGNWSPNGDQIVFISDRDGDLEVFKTNIDGSEIQQLTFNQEVENAPYWTPDGSIVYGSAISGNWEIFIMEADGSKTRQLTEDSGSYGVASYGKLGVTYISIRDKKSLLYCIINSKSTLVFPHEVGDGVPSWSSDGSMVTLFKKIDGHHEIYVFDNKDPEGRRITYLNSSN